MKPGGGDRESAPELRNMGDWRGVGAHTGMAYIAVDS